MNNWIMTDPIFESDIMNPKLQLSFWEGHRNFAYDFLNFVKPNVVLELGSQYGCSLFAFLQSIKDNNLKCEVNAVDFWQGEIGAEINGSEVFELVKKTFNEFFSNLNLNLYQMGFNEAINLFADQSIDVIHIDGGHRYEDVENDLNSWLPKLKENGIILFHDVYSNIDEGSCIHWKDTKKKYNYYFDFEHSYGLGVLFPKGNYWYNELENVGFFKFKDTYYYKSLYINKQLRFIELEKLFIERYRIIENQDILIEDRDKCIKSQELMIKDRDVCIKAQTALIDERDNYIKELTKKNKI